MERMDQTMLTVTSSQSSVNHLAWRRLYLNKAKLKAVSRTSALLSGFAIISMVELSIDEKVNDGLLLAYTINTTLLIAVHLLALMISTCILPNIESVSAMRSSIKDSPHESMHRHIQIAWMFSTVLGILLFFFEVALMCWVKLAPRGDPDKPFPGGKTAAIVSTCIILPAAVAFLAFACHFYRKLADHKYDRTNRNLEELEIMHSGLQNV